jgi:hypothetical protein
MRIGTKVFFGLGILALILLTGWLGFQQAKSDPLDEECENPGWFPTEFGLKDHSIFWHDGYYYIVSIFLPPEDRFAYGRSSNFCDWEVLSPILTERIPGAWDEMSIWAPFVYEEDGTFYMFYTGVTPDFTQSIMLATTTNPADPQSWQPQGMIFQPYHGGMIWEAGSLADCRDPTVYKEGDVYFLHYTGRDEGGGIVGLAISNSPGGTWIDRGAIIPPEPNAMLESPTIVQSDSTYYLFYNHNLQGEKFRLGPQPYGPWGEPRTFFPGWAHEVWQDVHHNWHTSYLTDYTISISPVSWDTFYDPAWPFIGDTIFRRILPVVIH